MVNKFVALYVLTLLGAVAAIAMDVCAEATANPEACHQLWLQVGWIVFGIAVMAIWRWVK